MNKLRYICLLVLVLVSQLAQGQTSVNNSIQIKSAMGAAPLQVLPTNGGLAYFDVNGILRNSNILSATTGLSFTNIAAISAVRGISGGTVSLRGFTYPGDGGAGPFYWDDTATSTTVGMSIAVSGVATGRWKRVFNGSIVQAKWMGVTADGVTNDSSSLQTGLNYVASIHGSLQLPNSVMMCRNLSIPDSVVLMGSGNSVLKGLTTLANGNAACLNILNRRSITIKDLEIDCSNFQGSEAGGNIAIRLTGDTTINLLNLYIHDNKYTGISFQSNCSDFSVDHCEIANTDVGIHMIGNGMGNTRFSITNNRIHGGTSEGITLQGIGGTPPTQSKEWVISGNQIWNKLNSSGIYILYGQYGTVADNEISNCKAGISGTPDNVTRPDYTAHIVVHHNILHNLINDGIGTFGNGSIVDHNILDSIGREGIKVGCYQDTTKWDTACVVEGNMLTHINYLKSPNWGGIRIQNQRYGKIINNTVYLGPGQDTITGVFAYKFIGNADSCLLFEGNVSIDGSVASNSNKADNYIIFRHNIVRNFNINWIAADSSTRKAVYDNNTYLSGSINGGLQPDPTGFLKGINGFNPRTVYLVGNSSRIRVIEGSYLQRSIKLISLFNGNTVVGTGGNILLSTGGPAILDSGKYVTLVWDGKNWNQTDANTRIEYWPIGSDTVTVDTSGAKVKVEVRSGRIALLLGANDQQDDHSDTNTLKTFRIAMPQYDDPKRLVAVMYGASTSTTNQLQIGAFPPNFYYNFQTITFSVGTHGSAFTGTPAMSISQPDNAVHIGSSTASGTADIALRKTYTDVTGMGYVYRSHATFASPSGSTENYAAYWVSDSVNNIGNGIMSGFLYDPKYVASTGGQAAFYAKNTSGYSLYAPSGSTLLWQAGSLNLGVSNSTAIPSQIFSTKSTTQGSGPAPSMTNTQRDAISGPVEGTMIYSLTDHTYEFYNGTVWKLITTN